MGAGNPCEAAVVASVEVAGCSVAAAEGPIGVAGGNLTATVATDSAAHCSSGADWNLPQILELAGSSQMGAMGSMLH